VEQGAVDAGVLGEGVGQLGKGPVEGDRLGIHLGAIAGGEHESLAHVLTA
jgi:hypothetical protein